jgi:hypothetical protein
MKDASVFESKIRGTRIGERVARDKATEVA